MTKKDYVAIAAVLSHAVHVAKRHAFDEQGMAACSLIAHDLCQIFQDDNPRFDRARFLAACGVQS